MPSDQTFGQSGGGPNPTKPTRGKGVRAPSFASDGWIVFAQHKKMETKTLRIKDDPSRSHRGMVRTDIAWERFIRIGSFAKGRARLSSDANDSLAKTHRTPFHPRANGSKLVLPSGQTSVQTFSSVFTRTQEEQDLHPHDFLEQEA